MEIKYKSSLMKIGLHGYVYRWDGIEWVRSSVEKYELEREMRKQKILDAFKITKLGKLMYNNDFMKKRRKYIDGKSKTFKFGGHLCQ